MIPAITAIRTYFGKLGLDTEIADIYLALHTYGPQTMSALSRNARVERTRLYRLIDQLMDSNLVEIENTHKNGMLKAAPIANLNILIQKRAQELQSLQDELQMVEQLLGRNELSSPASRVHYYYGDAGIKQMFWNQTTAGSEVLVLQHDDWQFKNDDNFRKRWARACDDHNVSFRVVTNAASLPQLPELPNLSTEAGSSDSSDCNDEVNRQQPQHWQSRTIDRQRFAIAQTTVIYDTVTSYFDVVDGELYGVESYNQATADTQRQLFALLWSASQYATSPA